MGKNNGKTCLSEIPEFEQLADNFFQRMERMQRADIRSRIGLNFFNAGVMGPEGNLFLISRNETVRIYKFNGEGELSHTYEPLANEVNLKPIFDIDFADREIFIVTELGDIRAYSF